MLTRFSNAVDSFPSKAQRRANKKYIHTSNEKAIRHIRENTNRDQTAPQAHPQITGS